MGCPNTIVPGLEESDKITRQNPGIVVKINKLDEEQIKQQEQNLRPFGVKSLYEKDEWRSRQIENKYSQNPELERLAQERIETVMPEVEGKRQFSMEEYNRTQPEWKRKVDELNPIRPIGKLPKTSSHKEMAMALDANKVKSGMVVTNRGMADNRHKFYIPNGTLVKTRLDIPAYKRFNTWVVSIKSTFLNGTKYGQTSHLKNVTFPVTEAERKAGMRIAAGDMPKSPYATMQGSWINTSTPSARAMASKALKSGEWVEIGMNPYRDVDFYRKDTGERIYSADEVIQIGPLVMAKNVK